MLEVQNSSRNSSSKSLIKKFSVNSKASDCKLTFRLSTVLSGAQLTLEKKAVLVFIKIYKYTLKLFLFVQKGMCWKLRFFSWKGVCSDKLTPNPTLSMLLIKAKKSTLCWPPPLKHNNKPKKPNKRWPHFSVAGLNLLCKDKRKRSRIPF